MKLKGLALATTVAFSLSVQAGINQDFSDIYWPKEIAEKTKVKGRVKIKDEMLTTTTLNKEEKVSYSYPTGLKKKKNVTASFDWKTSAAGAGQIFSLSDWNRQKIFFKINIEGHKIVASSFSNGKYKSKRTIKPKKDCWYNFKVSTKGGTYHIVITELGKDIEAAGEVVYSSKEKKKKLRLNPNVTPALASHQMWKGQGKLTFFFDNIVIK